MKKIAILGSTGSIGTQTLDIVNKNEDLQVVGLAAGSNISMTGRNRFADFIRNWRLWEMKKKQKNCGKR